MLTYEVTLPLLEETVLLFPYVVATEIIGMLLVLIGIFSELIDPVGKDKIVDDGVTIFVMSFFAFGGFIEAQHGGLLDYFIWGFLTLSLIVAAGYGVNWTLNRFI